MKNELLELRKRVENGEHLVCNEGLFGWADLLITDGSEMAIRGEVVVITPYAAELSALIFRLKEICGCWLDYENKYAFYPELGIAANAYIKEHSDLKGLLLAVIDAAIELETHCNRHIYFAYGSNMDERQMECRCPDARLLGSIRLQGYRFALDAAGVATILPAREYYVEGLLWSVLSSDICNLDKHEGVATGCYRKEYIPIDASAPGQVALVYISNRSANAGQIRPQYMERILQAAKDHRLSNGYIQELLMLYNSLDRGKL